MAIVANASTEEVVSQGRKYYAGPLNVNVLAVNPTSKELEVLLGLKEGSIENEESYYIEFERDGEEKQGFNKVVFYVKNPEVDNVFRVEFLVAARVRWNQAGDKVQIINDKAGSVWAPSLEDITYEWYDKSTAREAYQGEANLMEFIQCWANVKSTDECTLDMREELFVNGNVNELRQLIASLPNNQVQIFTYIKGNEDGDKFYQKVVTSKFVRPYAKNTALWAKAFNGYAPQGMYHSNLSFGELDLTAPTPDTDVEGEGEDAWGTDD